MPRNTNSVAVFLAVLFLGLGETVGVELEPEVIWVQQFGSKTSVSLNDIKTDKNGFVYCGGSFVGSLNLGDSELTTPEDFIPSGFFAKYSSEGAPVWASKFPALQSTAIAANELGEAFVAGDISDGRLGFTNFSPSFFSVAYIAKCSATGVPLWASLLGQGEASELKLGVDGSIYILDVYGSWIVKADTQGKIVWTYFFDRGFNNRSWAFGDVCSDINGNVFVVSEFSGTVGLGSTNLTAIGENADTFLSKFSNTGKLLWVRTIIGEEEELGRAIASDRSGCVYVTGMFSSTNTSFGDRTNLASRGDRDMFLAKWDPDGNLLWARQAGGSGLDRGNDINLDAQNNIYVTGRFEGKATFGSISELTSRGSADAFCAKFDREGMFLGLSQLGGRGFDVGVGVSTTPDGFTYVGGEFSDHVKFGKTNLTSLGFGDGFLVKLDFRSPAILAEPIDQFSIPGATAQFTVTASGAGPLQYQWRRNGNDLSGATNATLILLGVGASDYASYSVLVRGAYGSVMSSVVTLSRSTALSIAFDAPLVHEGQTIGTTIARASITTNVVIVHLRSSLPSQLIVPESISIPANASSFSFAAIAVDDSVLELPQTVTVTATSDVYNDGTATIRVEDDDIPSLTLELATSSVSEGAGPNATMATLRRAIAKPFSITVQMTSSDTSAALVPTLVTIEANKDSVSFPVAAVDDSQADGPQESVLQASLSIGSPPVLVAQSAPVSFTVTDDDGPTLTLRVAKNMVGEGLDPATTVVITRNTGNSGNLEVTLFTSDSREAVLPVSATIPSGTNSVAVLLKTVLDGVSDGNKTVTLTATAPGFTRGQAVVVVTDIDLPDLVVISANIPAAGQTGAKLSVPVVIRNQGLAASTNSFVQRVFLSTDPLVGNDILVAQFSHNGSLGIDETDQQFVTVTLPQNPGTNWLIVQADAGDTIHEGLESNNFFVSTNSIQIEASYHATVSVSEAVLISGSPVTISGQAFATSSREPARLVHVNVHVFVNGTVRTIVVTTDADGHFSAVFQPIPGEGGSFTVIAAYPGVQNATDDGQGNTAHFTMLAMRLEAPTTDQSLIERTPWQVRLRVVNLAPLPLHNLRVEIVSKPDALNVSSLVVEGGGTLSGSGEAFINLQAVAADAAIPRGALQLKVTSDEGVQASGTIRYSVSRQRANLFADISRVETSVVRTNQRTIEFILGNNGMTASGEITLLFPPIHWMNSPQGQILPSLAPGESRSVSLSLTPDQTVALTEHRGSLILSSATSQLGIPFSFRVVSDALADFAVTTVDEYFYYAEGKPKLSGAMARLLDPFSGVELKRGLSDTNGLVRFPGIMEGPYTLEVSAPDHSSYRNTVFIQPGLLNERQVFLSRETVRYIWTVEPTEIAERFNIVVESRFEANVPAPVIVVEPTVINIASLTEAGQQMQVNVRIANHGLISWQGVKLRFNDDPSIKIQALIEDLGTLAAQSEVSIPVVVTRLAASTTNVVAQPQLAETGDGPMCVDVTGEVSGFHDCGDPVNRGVGLVVTTGCNPNIGPNIYNSRPQDSIDDVKPEYSSVSLSENLNCDECAEFSAERIGDQQRMICADETDTFDVKCKNGHVTSWTINGQQYQNASESFTPLKSDLSRLKYGPFHEPGPYDVVATCQCDRGGQSKLVSFTVLVPQVKLSVAGLDERDKQTKGVYLISNGDDDNQNGIQDFVETGESPQENDLLTCMLLVNRTGLRNAYLLFEFEGGSSVKIYRDSHKGQQIDRAIDLEKEEAPGQIFLENVRKQTQPESLVLKVTLVHENGQCVDRLLIRLYSATLTILVNQAQPGSRDPYRLFANLHETLVSEIPFFPPFIIRTPVVNGHTLSRLALSDSKALPDYARYFNQPIGFFPVDGPTPCKPNRTGVVRIPDRTKIWTDTVRKELSVGSELRSGLEWLNAVEASPPEFHLYQYNCTSFTIEFASQLGWKLPLGTGTWPMRGGLSDVAQFVNTFVDFGISCSDSGSNPGAFGEDLRTFGGH